MFLNPVKSVRSTIRRAIGLRLISCNTCGVTLQSRNSKQIGFYVPPKTPLKQRQNVIEEAKYLLFSQGIRDIKADENASQKGWDEQKPAIICKRCSDALHHNSYKPEDFRKFSTEEVYKHIPQGSDVAHVVPLSDFPLHLDSSILSNKSYSTTVLLSKGDQITPDKSLLQRKAPQFFKDLFRLKLGYDSNKNVAFSATQGWNIQSVYSMLQGSSFLVGCPNTGKSTLVNSLLKKYGGRKLTEAENTQHESTTSLAGVSHIPNMTRNLQSYHVGDKILNDLPGYSTETNEAGLEEIIDAKLLQRIQKTHLFKKKKLVKGSYASVKGTDSGGCYTVSGIFYLVPPPGTINQVVNYIPGNERQYRNLDKALFVVKGKHETPDGGPLSQYVGTKKQMSSKEHYVRHILPPFQGTVEIVFKDVGYIQLKTTGKYEYRGLHEIWVPRGIEVCIREPLARLIEQGFERYLDSKGKDKAVPVKREVFSSTYPMSPDETNTLAKMQEIYLERTSNDVMARRHMNSEPADVIGSFQEESPNLYWYYKW